MSILEKTERATIEAACYSLEVTKTIEGRIMIVNQIIKCLNCYSKGGCYKKKLKKHAISVRKELIKNMRRINQGDSMEDGITAILISACRVYLDD